MSDTKGNAENSRDNDVEENADVGTAFDNDVNEKDVHDNPPMTSGAEFPLISFEETSRIERIITAHKNREAQPKVIRFLMRSHLIYFGKYNAIILSKMTPVQKRMKNSTCSSESIIKWSIVIINAQLNHE